jgi:hypothetical protein
VATRIAVSQSNYIPWKGYFDLINLVDLFVLFDDAQFTRRDWRNRNLIKTPSGLKWLTIPVETKGKFLQKISETRVSDADWSTRHWKTLVGHYSRAPHFADLRAGFETLYTGLDEPFLSRINHRFISEINRILGIRTPLRWSSEFDLTGANPSERILGICRQAGAGLYLSGPAAKGYLDEELFRRAGVAVEWMDYDGYPEYRQLHGPFQHGVSVLDLLFCEGPHAPRFMKSFAKRSPQA